MKVVLLVGLMLLISGCSEEQQNRLSRLGVSWLEGDYKVTFFEGSFKKEWIVRNSKVTSESQKGYYYFWAMVDGKKKYIQTPIDRTVIEEI
ncbi:MAG: hypothetical protein COB26_02820 [Piscirickettsiaceae bacterium]|nr:MAG: hypothetical protein COB89_05070 [Piscirickettsiaceae bacterium]PCI71007.1 MAG: hypothetical protein COB26_02820 [Piscirickettsiaceae bacterium]